MIALIHIYKDKLIKCEIFAIYCHKYYRCFKIEYNHSSNYISRLSRQLVILINEDLDTHLPQNVSE